MIEQQIEQSFVATLVGLKYEYRPDITDAEFTRLLDEIVTPDVFAAAKALDNEEDIALYNRSLNLLSHGMYAIHEPTERGEDNKELFWRILRDFTTKIQFALPDIVENPPAAVHAPTPVAAASAALKEPSAIHAGQRGTP